MNIRVEFGEHETPNFRWVLRLCKKLPSYRVVSDDGLAIHSVEFTDKEHPRFRAIHEILTVLPRVAYFLDDHLVPKDDLFRIVSESEAKRRLDRWAAEQQERERLRAFFHRNPSDAFLARLKKYGLLGNLN